VRARGVHGVHQIELGVDERAIQIKNQQVH
jgi:hypothetical protein